MSKIAVILLLNNHDLFIKKIRLKRIQNVPTFANYRGGDHNAADGVNYILQKFRSQIIHSKKDDVQHIVTNVLDTESANKIILMCKGAIEMISNDEHKGRD